MKFRYLLIDEDGDVKGTNDKAVADEFIPYDYAYAVVDAEEGKILYTDESVDIEEQINAQQDDAVQDDGPNSDNRDNLDELDSWGPSA